MFATTEIISPNALINNPGTSKKFIFINIIEKYIKIKKLIN